MMKRDDSESVFHYENISIDSAIINWNKIKCTGRRVKHFYVEFSDVKDWIQKYLKFNIYRPRAIS
jgi:hypothetical protein